VAGGSISAFFYFFRHSYDGFWGRTCKGSPGAVGRRNGDRGRDPEDPGISGWAAARGKNGLPYRSDAGHYSGKHERNRKYRGKLLEDALFSQAKEGQALLVQVAVLGLTGAVFSHAASAFKGSQIPETAFYMIYLLIFTCLAGSFLSSIQITAQVLDQILEFVRLLMPAYFISVAFAGGSTSAAAFYEIALGAAWAVQWLCRQVFLSIVRVYGLLVLGDHMMEEPFFSKMTELMEKIVSWGLRSILGLTLGLQILQSLVLPYADSAGRSAIMKFAEMIPGLGQATGAAARLVFGSSVLIKNSLGAAAVLILAVITLVPVVKLAVLMVMYQGAAALLQPVCDKRIISCIQGMAAGHGLLLRITLYSLFLFILVIAITCAGTNVTYLAA